MCICTYVRIAAYMHTYMRPACAFSYMPAYVLISAHVCVYAHMRHSDVLAGLCCSRGARASWEFSPAIVKRSGFPASWNSKTNFGEVQNNGCSRIIDARNIKRFGEVLNIGSSESLMPETSKQISAKVKAMAVPELPIPETSKQISAKF